MKKYIDLLKKTRLFLGMNEEEILSMLDCLSAVEREFSKGEYIYNTGDMIDSVAMVLEGSVHIEREDYWGNNSILSDAAPGELFGEVYALMANEPAAVNASAAVKCRIMMMDISRVFSACSNICPYHARLIQNLMYVVASKNKFLTDKVGYLSQRTTRDKLMAYLSDQSVRYGSSAFDIPFNRQQLADYLAVDRSAMSKELSRLRCEGVLDYSKNHFILKD